MVTWRSLILVCLWVFAITAEAQYWDNYSEYDSFNDPYQYERPITPPVGPRRDWYKEPDEVLIYGHPDDGPPSQAPYLRVPIETTPSRGHRGYYRY